MTDGNKTLGTDEAIEALLRKAPPRTAPSEEAMADVRDASVPSGMRLAAGAARGGGWSLWRRRQQ